MRFFYRWAGSGFAALCILLLGSHSCLSFSEDLSRNYGRFFADGPTSKRVIALTFDDGPSASTPQVLELLRQYGAKATFFMLGNQVQRYPDFARQVLKEGHQIGNHSFSHPNFYFYKKDDKAQKLALEISTARDAIKKATGLTPEYMRMPHGYVRDWVKEVAKQEHVILVNWTYGSDWTNISKEEMLKGYFSRLRPGAILLMHDGEGDRSKTLWVLKRVLEEIKKKNLKPVRIDELLQDS
jgi:peptidoglycan/xylan/chitin deacetylase (PgdA/CDA1 family)